MKYNILLLHTHDSGCYFSPYGFDVPTPNLQRFANEGIVFEQAFCTSPTCSPSRSSLMSGRYPHSNGMIGLANRGFAMNNYQQHMANIFSKDGYETVLCGIQHEFGHYGKSEEALAQLGYQKNLTAPYKTNNQQYMDWDEANTNNLIQWLKEDHDKKFFASMGFFSTHRMYPEADKEYPVPSFLKDDEIVKKDWAGHCASLAQFDNRFGRIVEALKEQNLYEQTIILFTSDHGIPFPFAKCTLYEQGIHVACVMHCPDIKATRYTNLFSHVDILPTLCELNDMNIVNDVEGISYANVLSSNMAKRTAIFAEINFHTSYEPCRCVRTSKYKYIRYYDDTYKEYNISNIDDSPTKDLYMEAREMQGLKNMEALYDIEVDPLERHNLIDDITREVDLYKMRTLLKTWQVETEDYLLDNSLKWRKEWIVNNSDCIDPKNIEEKNLIVIE